jgi:hypothetical protein
MGNAYITLPDGKTPFTIDLGNQPRPPPPPPDPENKAAMSAAAEQLSVEQPK